MNNRQGASALFRKQIPYLELTYCLQGEMHYHFNGEDIILRAGDAILYPENSIRERYETDTPVIYCSINLSMSEDFKPEVCGYLPSSMRFDTVSVLESMIRSFNSLADEKNRKCISLFFYLYYQLIETRSNNEAPHIKDIKQYIAAHLTESITLAEISEAVHLTPSYCCTVFSRYTGQSIVQFINASRIELAKGMMVTSDRTLTEISEACGFNDYNYFSRLFKQYGGCSARQYRRGKESTGHPTS